MTKALIVGLGKQDDIVNAFANKANVVYWDWTSTHVNFFSESVITLQKNFNPDIIFFQIQTPNVLLPSVAKELAKKSYVINWTGDVRYPLPEWYIDVGKHIHLTLFSNMNDVYEAQSRGVKADYLQIGFPNKIFKKKGKKSDKAADIVFMGNNSGGFPLSPQRVEMVNLLKKKYGDRFKSFGSGFGEIISDQQEESSIYRGSKIAISLSHFNYERYYSDRLLRIMGSGCLAISHDFKGIEKEFDTVNHLRSFSNFEQLINIIDYMLINEDVRKNIANEGCDHVHLNHTWKNRIIELWQKIY